MKNQTKAYIFALLAVLFWSTVATAFKIALNNLTFSELLFFSTLFSLLILFLILVIQKKLYLLRQQNLKDYLFSAILGLLNPFLYYIILFRAYDLLPAQEALTLNYTWAVVVVILSIPLLKQKIRPVNFIALLISFFGVVIIATHGNPLSLKLSNTFGVGLALGSSVIWALFWLLNIRDKRDEVLKLFMNFIFGAIYISLFQIINFDMRLPDLYSLLPAVYIGFFEMGITFVLWLLALKYSETTAKVSNLIYLSPFLSLFFINIFLHEAIHLSSIFGLILIVSGILIQQVIRK
ncbi:MAG: DMT family transporter [bacterium]